MPANVRTIAMAWTPLTLLMLDGIFFAAHSEQHATPEIVSTSMTQWEKIPAPGDSYVHAMPWSSLEQPFRNNLQSCRARKTTGNIVTWEFYSALRKRNRKVNSFIANLVRATCGFGSRLKVWDGLIRSLVTSFITMLSKICHSFRRLRISMHCEFRGA